MALICKVFKVIFRKTTYDTIHKIDLSSAQQTGYKNLLKAHPDKYLVNKEMENRAILIGNEKINKLAAKAKIEIEPHKPSH